MLIPPAGGGGDNIQRNIMAEKDHRFSKVISWLTLAYFVILFAERAQSIVRIIIDDRIGMFDTGFDIYANIITIVSMSAAIFMLIVYNDGFFRSLFDGDTVPDYSMLAITSGVILVSGMVHTEFTIAPVQFGAYGALIVAMILRTAETAPGAASKFKLWYSLAFLTVFSMAIPVMYHTHIELALIFHIIAALTALILVFFFTYMMRLVFVGKAEDLLMTVPTLIMAALDAVVIYMRWDEEINAFAMIFAILAAVMFIAGKIIFAVKK